MTVSYGGFEWDSKKNEINQAKHKISFELAVRAFNDPCLLEKYDFANSSEDEDRFISLGLVEGILLIFVSHTDRNGKIRIISARKAVRKEVKEYERHRKNLQTN